MTTGVWSVNGTVSLEKTIKLHGLLSGEDYDLTMEPRGMRGIVIKDKAWVCSDRETWHAGSPDDRLPTIGRIRRSRPAGSSSCRLKK